MLFSFSIWKGYAAPALTVQTEYTVSIPLVNPDEQTEMDLKKRGCTDGHVVSCLTQPHLCSAAVGGKRLFMIHRSALQMGHDVYRLPDALVAQDPSGIPTRYLVTYPYPFLLSPGFFATREPLTNTSRVRD